MKRAFTLFFIFSLFAITVQARTWNRVLIPDAYCGDGHPYYVFIDHKYKNRNLLIEFMGGGACWSRETCWGLDFRTWIHPLPQVPAFSYLTSDFWLWSSHPFVNDSALFFPYCTGDVYAGNHVAEYKGFPVHHQGYSNVLKTLDYLKNNNYIDFESYRRVTVWGASAGAIGSLIHLQNIEKLLPANTEKYAIIDSPGLHFGKNFWKKFTPELQNDFKNTFSSIGLEISLDDGFVTPHIQPVFERLRSWRIGFLQATRDLVMSEVFGDISQSEHRKLMLSDQGLEAMAAPYLNIRVWTSDSPMHTFLLTKTTSNAFWDEQFTSSQRFVRELIFTPPSLAENSF